MPRPPAGAQQRKAAQSDARDDGGTASRLERAGRVPEQGHPGHRAHERLEVDERPGDLRGHPALPVGEEREGQQRAARGESHSGQDGARAVWHRGQALRDGGERQHGEGRTQELHGGDRDGVLAMQQANLPDGERGGQQQRHEHQPVARG